MHLHDKWQQPFDVWHIIIRAQGMGEDVPRVGEEKKRRRRSVGGREACYSERTDHPPHKVTDHAI
jgi:hypothetical protein